MSEITCTLHGHVGFVSRPFDGDKLFESHMSDNPDECDYSHYNNEE